MERPSDDTAGVSNPRPRSNSTSGSALPEGKLSKDDEQSSGERTPTNISSSRYPQPRSRSLKELFHRISLIVQIPQRKNSRAPHHQGSNPTSTVVKGFISRARLLLPLKTFLLVVKAVLEWYESYNQGCKSRYWRRLLIRYDPRTDTGNLATFDNSIHDHFILSIQTYMTAGMISVTEWHDDEMRQARNGAQKEDGALEYFLRNVFSFWAKLVEDLNEVNVMTAEEIVSIETWERKREAIEGNVMAISDSVEFAILKIEKEILRVKRDTVSVAKRNGKLTRGEVERRRPSS